MLARRKAEISQHHKVACRLEPVAEIDQLFERPVRVHIHSQTLEENVLALRLIFEADSRELDLRLFGATAPGGPLWRRPDAEKARGRSRTSSPGLRRPAGPPETF